MELRIINYLFHHYRSLEYNYTSFLHNNMCLVDTRYILVGNTKTNKYHNIYSDRYSNNQERESLTIPYIYIYINFLGILLTASENS